MASRPMSKESDMASSRPMTKESGLSSARSHASSVESIEDENEDYAFSDEILPDGWKRFFDDLTGQWYFVDVNTQRSTWIKPGDENPFLPPITRAPILKKDVPKTFITSTTQVPDPKLMTVADVPSIGPAYPDRQLPLSRSTREQFGIPSVPTRCTKDSEGIYIPYEPKSNTIRVNTRWVNLAPPVPLVPVHRPVWDDRDFWTLCGGEAEIAQQYNDFWLACYHGQIDEVERYLSIEKLDHAASIPLGWSTKNNTQLRGSTPLHLAVEGNHLELVKLLLSKPMKKWGVQLAQPSQEEIEKQLYYNNLNKKNKKQNNNNNNNLKKFNNKNSYASYGSGASDGGGGGGEDMKKKTKLNILIKDNHGLTPLLLAILKGNYKMVSALLKYDRSNFHVNECRDQRGASALHYACQEGHLQIAQLLHNKGNANLLSRDNRGITPLLLAERKGHATIVAWLLEQPEVPWDGVDDYGMSVLMVACEQGDVGLVRDLCFKASYRIINSENREPVDPDDPSTFPVIKKKGKYGGGGRSKKKREEEKENDLNNRKLPFQALECYIEEKKEEKEEEKKETPMNALARAEAIMAQMKAAQEGKNNEKDDDDNIGDSMDMAPLEEEGNNKSLVARRHLGDTANLPRVLVPKHQRVWLDRKDKSGRTALVIATLHNHMPVVELLLSQKGRCGKFGRPVWLCDENARNGSSLGTRPVDVARENGHRTLQFYLIQVCKDRAEEEKERRKQLVHTGHGGQSPERRTIPL